MPAPDLVRSAEAPARLALIAVLPAAEISIVVPLIVRVLEPSIVNPDALTVRLLMVRSPSRVVVGLVAPVAAKVTLNAEVGTVPVPVPSAFPAQFAAVDQLPLVAPSQ